MSTESARAIEDARSLAERLFHAYSSAATKATSPAGRDLFGRLAVWKMHHFEEMERAHAAWEEHHIWVDYVPMDWEKADPGKSDRRPGSNPPGTAAYDEGEVLTSSLENERANYTSHLGLAAKSKGSKERDFWTAIAAEAALHVKVLKEQLDAMRVGGALTWLDVLRRGGPKPSIAAVRSAVSMISPLSTSDLSHAHVSVARSPGAAGEDGETELLPPGWEQLGPEKTKQFREVGWSPPPISDPVTTGWVKAGSPAAASAGAWESPNKEVPQPPREPEPPKTKKGGKNPSTVRIQARPPAPPIPPPPGVPERPFSPTDTAIMDRPQAHAGGRWTYEASVKTAEQLCAPLKPPPDADILALITGSARKAFLDILNRRGAQGWELLQLGFHKDTVVLFWKRRQ